jgi:hypothetical protein
MTNFGAPIIPLLLIVADMKYTTAVSGKDWDLPPSLAPLNSASKPNVRLLGWRCASKLTQSQFKVLSDADFNDQPMGCITMNGISINRNGCSISYQYSVEI